MKVLVAAIFGIFLSQANAYTVLETCAIVQSGTFIADPADCKSYYYCLDGTVDFHGSCGDDYVYNARTGACDYPSNYKCPFSGQICDGLSYVYLPDPLNCNSYIYCNEQEVAEYGSCGKQIYNQETNTCVHPVSGNSCSGDKCALVPNNHFVAGNSQSTSFTCFNGVGTENNCNEDGNQGLIYNSLTGQCEQGPADFEDASALCEDIPEEDLFAASTIDCNAYYYCSPDAPRIPTKEFCPQRFHFNQDTQECDYSWNIKPTNGCNRCGGYPAKSYVGSTSDCRTFEYCTGKVETPSDSGYCAISSPFFNERLQICQKTDPNEAYCA